MKLFMIVGLPKGGKTTYANQLKEQNPDAVVVSYDELRGTVPTDVEDIKAETLKLACDKIREAFSDGKDVIYDHTNVTRETRKVALDVADEFNAEKNAYIVWAPYEMCVERAIDATPDVTEDVIKSIIIQWQSPYYDEGFKNITLTVATDEAVDKDCVQNYVSRMMMEHKPNSPQNLWEHCHGANAIAASMGKPLDIIDAALWHDVGKILVRVYEGTGDSFMEEYHDNVGGYLVYGVYIAKHFPVAIHASWVVCHHMDAEANTPYYQSLPDDLKKKLDDIHEVTDKQTETIRIIMKRHERDLARAKAREEYLAAHPQTENDGVINDEGSAVDIPVDDSTPPPPIY